MVVSVRLTAQGSLKTGVIVELVWQRRPLLEEAGGGTGRLHGRLARDCLYWERKLRSCGADQYKIRSCRPRNGDKRQLVWSGLVVLMNRVLVEYGEGLDHLWRSEVDRQYCSAIAVLRPGEDQVNARITATWQGGILPQRLPPYATNNKTLSKSTSQCSIYLVPYALGM